jgi:hypothetical protein
MADRNPDNRTVTQGVGNVPSERAVGQDRPASTRAARRRRVQGDEEMLNRAEGTERANIAGGAVSNDDGVSKGGQ